MQESNNIAYPTLVMVRGLPGSGKSYLTDAVQKRIGKDVVVLDPDAIDKSTKAYQDFVDEKTREGLDPKINPFRWLRKQAAEAVASGKIAIWNQPFTDRGIFDRLVIFLQSQAEEHGAKLPVLLVEVEIDHDEAKDRITKRKVAGGHGPSDNTFARRIDEYTSYADGYTAVRVHGKADIEESVDAVLEGLQDVALEIK